MTLMPNLKGAISCNQVNSCSALNNAAEASQPALISTGRNIQNAGGLRGRKRAETCRRRARRCSLLISCQVKFRLLFVLMGSRKWNLCSPHTLTSTRTAFLSLSLSRCKCQTVIFRVNQMDEQKRHPPTPPPPPPL